eukprot:629705-Rhodomonas_salina.1
MMHGFWQTFFLNAQSMRTSHSDQGPVHIQMAFHHAIKHLVIACYPPRPHTRPQPPATSDLLACFPPPTGLSSSARITKHAMSVLAVAFLRQLAEKSMVWYHEHSAVPGSKVVKQLHDHDAACGVAELSDHVLIRTNNTPNQADSNKKIIETARQ